MTIHLMFRGLLPSARDGSAARLKRACICGGITRADWLKLGLWIALLLGACTVQAQFHKVLPAGQQPNDARLQPAKDVYGSFPFEPPTTLVAWQQRAERLRRQVLVSQGLWPLPTRIPLHPVVHGKIDQGDYTVEKVSCESLPGFFLTGSLYRPKAVQGRVPAVLCPHGHWDHGRFHDAGPQQVRQEIVQGAERFEEGGRSMFQSVCVQLARMGCIVFQYDMLGYADSVQISESLAHAFVHQRPEMNTATNWGFYSAQAEMHLQSIMGLQTWNSIRALDFLLSLPEVDPERLAVTGASGGGTQTLLLGAVDPRLAVAFPAVMVSTGMQGDCTCENACLLRIDTGNVELAALFAPKPLGMTAANDWTRSMPTNGFPQLQALYALMGKQDQVMLKPLLHFKHNYNYVSRAAVYQWFNRHLKLGLPEPVVEQDYHRLGPAELSVWDADHPKPQGGPEFEKKLLRELTEDNAQQIRTLSESPIRYRQIVGGAMDVVIGRTWADVGDVQFRELRRQDMDRYLEIGGLLRNETHGEELPVVLFQPHQASQRTVIWANGRGKAGLFEGDQPSVEVRQLLDAGCTVIGVDLLQQGEITASSAATDISPKAKKLGDYAAFRHAYNHSLFARRAQDLLTVIRYTAQPPGQGAVIALAGFDGAGPWAAAAAAQARDHLAAVALDTGGFRFGNLTDIQHDNFLPGGAKYGDVPALLALCAPLKLWVAGEPEAGLTLPRRFYQGATADQLARYSGAPERTGSAAVEWLIANLSRP